MFLNAPENPSRLKRIIYLSVTTVLGIFLNFFIYLLMEIGYFRWLESPGRIISFYGNFTLSPVFRGAFLTLGGVGGFFLGCFWWRKVYLERVWAKKYPADNGKGS